MMANISAASSPQVARVILYVKQIEKVAAFYQGCFGMLPRPGGTDKWLELACPAGGCAVALHRASVGQKSGAAIKLVFGVEDVRAFVSAAKVAGFEFGVIHEAEGFEFSNAKDPAGNSVQVSSRGMRRRA
jgi:predicted enzyme related to lactoylglutathione lyase